MTIGAVDVRVCSATCPVYITPGAAHVCADVAHVPALSVELASIAGRTCPTCLVVHLNGSCSQ